MYKFILWLLLGGILAGQLLQVTFGTIDIPLLDIFLGIGLLGLLISNKHNLRRLPSLPLFWPIAFFAGAISLSLIFNLSALDSKTAILVSGLYLARTLAYFIFGLLLTLTPTPNLNYFWKSFIWAGLLFSVIGFFQLAIFPDFQIFDHFGWDPHQGRLISSFLDPNYAATWLSLIIILGSVLVVQKSSLQDKLPAALSTVAMLLAHLLTLSRTGLLALAGGLGWVSWHKSKLLTVGLFLLAVLAIFLSPRLQSRISGIWELDATVRYRLESWETGAMLFADHPVLGIGYNTLKYRRYENALPGTNRMTSGQSEATPDSGSRADTGFDSSLLTVAATSGILGLLSFLWLILKSLLLAWANIKRRDSHIYSLWFIGITSSLLVSSLFINAWFYSPILLTWLIAMSLIQKENAT